MTSNSDRNFSYLLSTSSIFFSSVTFLLGVMVVLGWYIGSTLLVQVYPGFVPMVYNTALGMVLTGVALLMLNLEKSTKVVGYLGIVIGLIGGSTLLEYIFNINLGIDELFMKDTIGVKVSHPGRMAPNTALCFLLTGISLNIINKMPSYQRASGLMISVVLSLGLIAFFGYILGHEHAYGWGNLTRMALHTSICFLFIGISLITILIKDCYKFKIRWYHWDWLPYACFISLLSVSISIWYGLNGSFDKMATSSSTIVLIEGILESFLTLFLIRFVQKWKVANEKLENNNYFLDTVMEYMPSIVFVKDVATRSIRMVNGATLKMLGRSRDEVVGQKIESCFNLQDANKIVSLEEQSLKQKAVLNISQEEIEIIDGKSIFNIAQIPIMCKEGADVDYILTVMEDITEKKKIELEREKRKAEVENNARLLSLGTMAGGIAHEINNPISIVSMVSFSIRNKLAKALDNVATTEPSELRKEREDIIDQCKKIDSVISRVSKIIKGLKTISRDVSNDAMSLEKLTTVINDTMSICQDKLKRHGVKINVVGVGDKKIWCRGGEMSQVLTNLISNAYDVVCGLEDPWINIAVKEDEKNVIISMFDSGGGVAEDNIKKVMTPFFTTKPVGKGTGLGLSISNNIVKSHGGRLEYFREEYTEFRITFNKKENLAMAEKKNKEIAA